MMIELMLIAPLIFSFLILVFRTKKLNKFIILFYAFLHLCLSIFFYINSDYTSSVYFINDYFRIDPLNILFLLILSFVFLGVAIYNFSFMKKLEEKFIKTFYYSICVILFVFSMTATILSTNLALSWIFIEATTLTSVYLIYFDRTKEAIEASWKYLLVCSIGISLAFVGIILLLIGSESVNSLFFEDLYINAKFINPFWLKISFIFIILGLGAKMGLAPMYAWLPDAHSEAPSPISALLSATLLNTALLIILKVFKLMSVAEQFYYAKILFGFMGVLSVFVASIFILKIKNYKRMLAYSSIENMGIMGIGFSIGGLGVYAAFLHLIAHSLIKSSFFLTAGNILKIYENKKIYDVAGLIKVDKLTAWLWLFCFVAIVGFPPSIMFLSEFLLIKALLQNGQFFLLTVLLILLTTILYGIAKPIINMCFGEIKKGHEPIINHKLPFTMYLPQFVFILIVIFLGFYIPDFLNKLIEDAVLYLNV